MEGQGAEAILDDSSERRPELPRNGAVHVIGSPTWRETKGIDRYRGSVLVLVLGTLISAGCQSGIYKSASLPPRYRFPPTTAPASLDLTRLAGPSVSSTTIGPGDVLDVMLATGYEDRGIDKLIVRVDDDGIANVPLIGNVHVADLEPAEAERKIAMTAVAEGIFSRPNVTVLIRRKQTNRVTIVGAVNEPGVIQLDRSNSDLLGALAKAGGLTEDAGLEIQVLRKRRHAVAAAVKPAEDPGATQLVSHELPAPSGEGVSELINLAEVTQGGFVDLQLGDGDVVLVHQREPRVIHILGLVNEPKQINLPNDRDIRVIDALAEAGGRTIEIADKIHVIRHVSDQPQPIVVAVSCREAKKNGDANLILGPGDVVSVEETPTTFAVELMRSFLRFGISGTTALF